MSDDLDFDMGMDEDLFELDMDAGLIEEGEYEAKIESAEFKVNESKQNSKGINFCINVPELDQKVFKYVWLGNDEKVNRQGTQEIGRIVKAVTGEAPSGIFSLRALNPRKTDKGKVFFSVFEGSLVKLQVKQVDKTVDGETTRENRFTVLAAD